MADLSGNQIDKYRLIKRLGTGTFGDVYQGNNIYDEDIVAVKILKFELTKETIREFLNETRSMVQLKHTNIVPLLDFGIDNTSMAPFLVMAYAPHGTLRQRHLVGTRVPLETVISYVKPIAAALQYVHNKRLIHRDVKPSNMLLGDNNTILLSDFGVAVTAHNEHSLSTQNMSGTLPYMAPEQIERQPRPASDQYALAIVVYEWLCGMRPFKGSEVEIIDQHRSQLPPLLRTKNPAIPPAIEQVVLKALAKQPQERYPSVQAFADALEQAYKQSLPPTPSLPNIPAVEKKSIQLPSISSRHPVILGPAPDNNAQAPLPLRDHEPAPIDGVWRDDPATPARMRQGNGTDLLGANDPRSATIGVIYVSANNDRKSVLAAILTQEKLGREQIAVVLPPNQQNKAFQHPSDFDDLRAIRRKLKTLIIFIAPSGPGPAEFARQRRFPVYSTIENYANALRQESQIEGAEKQKANFVSPEAKLAGTSIAPIVPVRNRGVRRKPTQPLSPQRTVDEENAAPFVAGAAGAAVGGAAAMAYKHPRDPEPIPETPVVMPVRLPLPSRPSRTSRQLPAAVVGDALGGVAAASVAAPMRNPGRTMPATGAGMSTVAPRPSRLGGPPPRGVPPGRSGRGGSGRGGASRRTLLIAGIIILLLALLLCGGYMALAQQTTPVGHAISSALGLSSSGTVTITPDSKPITDTYTLTSADKTIVATVPTADMPGVAMLTFAMPTVGARSVAVRTIAGTAQSTAVQVNATGQAVRAATQAHGTITFFNAVTTAQQVNAGTRFPVGGGVTLVTDADASIPAGNPPTEGQKTVVAHAEPAGRGGNVGAVLNSVGCCGTGIVVSNTTDFTGGQDASNYKFLQKSDVTNAVTTQMLDTTKQSAMGNLSNQLHTGEQVLGTPQCNPVISLNQPLGDNGANAPVSSANVIYRMKCTATAYDYAGAQLLVSGLLAQKAATTLPRGYFPVSNIQVSLTNQITANGITSFFFLAKGVWAYQFSDQQKLNIAKSIAGKTVAEAKTILKNTPGIDDATVMVSSGGNLPTDPGQLSIQVQPQAGSTTTGLTTSAPVATPTISPPNVSAPTIQSVGGGGGK